MPNPNISQMLTIGKECGLTTLLEAYDNYMLHYDCFFTISEGNTFLKFIDDLITEGLCTRDVDGIKYTLKPYTIEQCEMIIGIQQLFLQKTAHNVIAAICESETRLHSSVFELLNRWLSEEQSVNSMVARLGVTRRNLDKLVDHFNLRDRVEAVKKANQKKRSKFKL